MIKVGDHDLILGQLFLNSIKFSQEYKSDRVFGTITHSHTYQTAIFWTLASKDPTNQKENQIFPHLFNQLNDVL